MSLRHAIPLTAGLVLAAGAMIGCPPRETPPPNPAQTDENRPDEESPPDDPDATGDVCGTTKVDLLFVIDNSGSMSQEQAKLARMVPELLGILATGNRNGKRSVAGEPTDFMPAESIHVGVISTDLGVNGAQAQNSCGDRSFLPADPDPTQSTQRLNKPFGDDGKLLNSTEVAVAGIYGRTPDFSSVEQTVPPDPGCANVVPNKPYLEFEPGDLFEDTGVAFSCISKLGRNGCGLEQQLEAMLKALTPADGKYTFSGGTHGQGTRPGANAGFLREDAILAIVQVSDEEDCSSPDESRALYDAQSTALPGEINVRCGMPENQHWLHPVERYSKGLLALKPKRYQDRIIFAGIVGAPLAADVDGLAVHSGQDALDELLARPDMQFSKRLNVVGSADEPVPTCVSPSGDGSAAPGRRTIELAGALGDNGVITSICEDSYQPLIAHLSERISSRLGSCD